MKRNKLFIAALYCGMGLAGMSGCTSAASANAFSGYRLSGKTELTRFDAAMLPPLETVEETVRDSELIVYAQVEDLEYRPEEVMPFTIGTIRVDQCLKGELEEGTLIRIRKRAGYTTPSARKKGILQGLVPDEELEKAQDQEEDLQLSILDGDWPLEQDSRHIFCLYPEGEENGEPVYNIVWGAQSEWIEMAPDTFYETAQVRSHFTSGGSTEGILQEPYSSHPPCEEDRFARGKTLEELIDLYEMVMAKPAPEKKEPDRFAV